MKTLRKIIEEVKLGMEDASIHPQNINALSKSMVYSYLVTAHNSIKYRFIESEKRYQVATDVKTYVSCVKIYEVNKSECPCDEIQGCTWFKTSLPLPKRNGKELKAVYLSITGGDTHITETTLKELPDIASSFRSWQKGKDKFVQKTETDGDHIYFSFSEGKAPERVTIGADFADIVEVMEYRDIECTGSEAIECTLLDEGYPIDARYEMEVITQASNSLLRYLRSLGVEADILTDAIDGSVAQRQQNFEQ